VVQLETKQPGYSEVAGLLGRNMSHLVNFAKRVANQLGKANAEPHWTPEEAERYMADVGLRHERFEQVASQLVETVIQPRLETVASRFPNASLRETEPLGHCMCWFGYCERFPSSTSCSFSVEHDVRVEKVVVRYEATMMPTFFKFDEHDRLSLALDEVDDAPVANWVETRLLEFLDAYLQVDRGGEDFNSDVVVDPVCGMRISRTSAAASGVYLGHPYFFCSTDCQLKFSIDPKGFVQVVTT
jgi:YHS domain-containing protein